MVGKNSRIKVKPTELKKKKGFRVVQYFCAGLEIFTAMSIQVMVCWVMTLCSDGGAIHFTLKMEAEWPSEMLVSYHMTT
jgi:hypothetical protein